MTKQVEAAWSAMCNDAGYTSALYCSPDQSKLQTYYAKLDALIGEREASLRELIQSARKGVTVFEAHYLDGIEAAIYCAISSPRI